MSVTAPDSNPPPSLTRAAAPAPNVDDRVRAELLHLVYSDQRVALTAALVFAAGIAAMMARSGYPTFAGWWIAATAGSLTLRFFTAGHFLSLPKEQRPLRKWERIFLAQSALTALSWGSIAWYAQGLPSPVLRGAILLLIGGVVAAAGRTLACQFGAFVLYTLISALPVTRHLLLGYDDGGPVYAGLYLSYLGLMLGLGASFRRTVANAFRLQLENADLARRLQDDMAARAVTEAALRESEGRLRFAQYALDHAQDLIALVDRDGQLLHVSDALRRYTGHDPAELARRKIWENIVGGTPEAFAERWVQIKAAGALTFDLEILDRGGEKQAVEVNASYVEFNGREVMCAIARDITPRRAAEQERQRLQDQLQETQRLESLGVLAGGVAHDFNNLLTAILGNASLARDCLDKPAQAGDFITQVENAANQAAGLCRQMLAYAGRGHVRTEAVQLPGLITESARLLEMTVACRARLELKLDEGLPPIMADASQVRQIVMNLVHNASEAIPHHHGQIRIAARAVTIDAAMIATARVRAAAQPGPGVTLSVSDNGAGMDRSTLERIFEPFFTTKFTGRGLGLPAVLGIVRSHRALLHVESTVGKGSTFRVTFPAATEEQLPERLRPVQTATPFEGGCALIVDDEEAVRRVATQVLERLGFTVEVAVDADSALRGFTINANRFALMLVDMTMPGADGATLLAELRQRGITSPAILMSGHSDEQIRRRIEADPACRFLHKPFDLTSLRDCVRAALKAGKKGMRE